MIGAMAHADVRFWPKAACLRQTTADACISSDEFTVPLCRGHHRQLHQVGNETAWWRDLQIDGLEIARGLWQQSRAASTSIT